MNILAVSDGVALLSGIGGALLGAVVGGLVTGKVTRDIEARRQQEDARRERMRESAEILGIVRVHLDELDRIAGAVGIVREGEELNTSPESLSTLFPRLPREERRLIGRHLTRETWGDLTSAHMSVDLFFDALSEHRPDLPLPEDGDDFLRETLEAIDKGEAALVMLEKGALSEFEDARDSTGQWATATSPLARLRGWTIGLFRR